MTLSLAIHNKKDIILATDTMSIETFLADGRQQVHYDTPKLYQINNHSAFVIAGNFDTNVVPAVLNGFVFNVRDRSMDIDSLFRYLWDYLRHTLPMWPQDELQIIIAGYTKDNEPRLRSLKKTDGEISEFKRLSDFYDMIGYEKPMDLAKDLIKKAKLDTVSSVLEIEKTAVKAVKESIKKYPDLVGGEPNIVKLSSD